jgi:hypothetical protein
MAETYTIVSWSPERGARWLTPWIIPAFPAARVMFNSPSGCPSPAKAEGETNIGIEVAMPSMEDFISSVPTGLILQ